VALPPPLADLGETGAVLCWPGAPPGPGQSAGESSACPASPGGSAWTTARRSRRKSPGTCKPAGTA